MDEATRSAWCREQGLYPAELDAWKQDAIAGLGEPRTASAVEARQDRRRGKELERELHRKDKALAETAALLVLRKNLGRQRLLACCVDGSSRQWLLEARDGQGVGAEAAGAGAGFGPVAAGLPGLGGAHAAALREPPACGDPLRRGAAAVADPLV